MAHHVAALEADLDAVRETARTLGVALAVHWKDAHSMRLSQRKAALRNESVENRLISDSVEHEAERRVLEDILKEAVVDRDKAWASAAGLRREGRARDAATRAALGGKNLELDRMEGLLVEAHRKVAAAEASKQRLLTIAVRNIEEEKARAASVTRKAQERIDMELAQRQDLESHWALKEEGLNNRLVEMAQDLAEVQERAARMQKERDTELSLDEQARQQTAWELGPDLLVEETWLNTYEENLGDEKKTQRKGWGGTQGGVSLRGTESSPIKSLPPFGEERDSDFEALAIRSRKDAPSFSVMAQQMAPLDPPTELPPTTSISGDSSAASHVRNIQFPFDVERDTAYNVAKEMVMEFEWSEQDVEIIADMIDAEVATLVPNYKELEVGDEWMLRRGFRELQGEETAVWLSLSLSQAELERRRSGAAKAGGQVRDPVTRHKSVLEVSAAPIDRLWLRLQRLSHARGRSCSFSRTQQEDASPGTFGREAEESAPQSERHSLAAHHSEEELMDVEGCRKNEQAASSPTPGFFFPQDLAYSGLRDRQEPKVERPLTRTRRQSQGLTDLQEFTDFYNLFPVKTAAQRSSPRSQHSAPLTPTRYSHSPSLSDNSNSSPPWHGLPHQTQAPRHRHSVSLPHSVGDNLHRPLGARSNSGASSPDESSRQPPYATKGPLSLLLKREDSWEETTQQPASVTLDTPDSILDPYGVTPFNRGRHRAIPHTQGQSGRSASSSCPPSSQRPVQAARKIWRESQGSSPVGAQSREPWAFDEFGELPRNPSTEGLSHAPSSSAAGSDREDVDLTDQWFPSGEASHQLDSRFSIQGASQPVPQHHAKGTGTVQGSPGKDWSRRWGHDVFISHAGEDKPFASQLHDYLKRVDLEAFLDEEHLHGGDYADLKMLLAMRNAPIGLVLMGKTFFSKSWPMKELKEIVNQKTLLPILYKLSYEEVEELLKQSSTLGERPPWLAASSWPLFTHNVLRTTMVTNPSTKKNEAPFLEHIVVEVLRRFAGHVCPRIVNSCEDHVWAYKVLQRLENACSVIKREFHALSVTESKEVKAWEQMFKQYRTRL